MSTLTVVVYHYVRDLANTPYPEIKGRTIAEFEDQLDYVEANFEVVTAEQVMAAMLDEEPLPERACWLTFDDGYSDHYRHVFPVLADRALQGSFFVPVRPVLDRELLDVNRAHFVLATADPAQLVDEVRDFCEQQVLAGEPLSAWSEYQQTYAHANRWDPPEVVFVKRMLQRGLPEHLRHQLANQLFQRHVTKDADAFAADLYMSRPDVQTMIDSGMYIGSHGTAHHWLDSLDAQGQAADIDRSLSFLRELGCDLSRWVMCYPYGAYDETTLRVLQERNCTVGLTTASGQVEVPAPSPLELPRIDTNELPLTA